MTPISRRQSLLCLTGMGALAAPAFSQEPYPSRPIRVIVSFGAGGAGDTVARLVQPRMAEALGQSVVIENRPGAGGAVGGVAVARSRPDGYTLLIEGSGHVINPLLNQDLPINYETSFSYISAITVQPWVWIVSERYAARDLQGFVEEARRRGGSVIFGTSGIGSAGHLSGGLLAQRTGLQLEHLPYRSGAEAGTDVASGNLDVACLTISSALLPVNAGKARFVATTGARRSVALPDVPTFAESGLPGFDVTSWMGVFGPAGLPTDVIRTVNAAVAAAMREETVRARLTAAGFEPLATTPEAFAAMITHERAVFSALVRSLQRTAVR
jgi:tripartite-type tricarboxylate transporter receptor subunit TctC